MCASSRKAFVVFLTVLLVASSSLSAFSFFSSARKSEEKRALALQEEVKQAASEVQEPLQQEAVAQEERKEAPSLEALAEPQPQSSLEKDSESESTRLSSLLESLETQRKMDQRQLTDLIGALNNIKDDYDIVMADSKEKQEIIDELTAANSQQADDLAYIRGRYDKEVASKFFMNTGLALGYKGNTPIYGIVGNFGIRFGAGLLLGAGVQYMAGSFKEVPFTNWSTEDLTIQLTVGWEW